MALWLGFICLPKHFPPFLSQNSQQPTRIFFILKSFGIFFGGGIQVCPSNYDEREKEYGKQKIKRKRKKKGLKKSEEEIKREKLGLITWIN